MATSLLAFSLSLGPRLSVLACEPWPLLVDLVPGMAQVRNVFRFAFFVQLSVVLLAIQGLHALIIGKRLMARRAPASSDSKTRWGTLQTWAANIGIVVLCLLAVFETTPARPVLAGVPDETQHTEWIEFVKRSTPDDHGVWCLPMAQGNKVSDFEVNDPLYLLRHLPRPAACERLLRIPA